MLNNIHSTPKQPKLKILKEYHSLKARAADSAWLCLDYFGYLVSAQCCASFSRLRPAPCPSAHSAVHILTVLQQRLQADYLLGPVSPSRKLVN